MCELSRPPVLGAKINWPAPPDNEALLNNHTPFVDGPRMKNSLFPTVRPWNCELVRQTIPTNISS